MTPDLFVTLWPSFPHFERFAKDPRLAGIRLNSAMMNHPELGRELALVRASEATVPLYFDVKGRQLRVTEVLPNPEYLDFRVNHPIRVPTPTVLLLKAGGDAAMLGSVSEGGYRLTCSQNPRWSVRAGESIHIKDPALEVGGPIFTDAEKAKIAKVVASGLISRWFISYVEDERDLAEFRELVGPTTEVFLKIESKRGLEYARTATLEPGERLVAACGDMFVEVDEPHHILSAARTVIQADPEALVGSRLLLSTCRGPSTYLRQQVTRLAEQYPAASAAVLDVLRDASGPRDPDFADFAQLAWLYDVGYRSFMLCDELCLRGDLLDVAVAAFDSFRKDYCR
jgi:hypothetical protein